MVEPLLIAVPVAETGTISEQAGRTLYWKVFYSVMGTPARFAWHLNLTEEASMHEWHVRGEGNKHPLHFVDVVLVRSAGHGVIRRLEQRGTEVYVTEHSDPLMAVHAYQKGLLEARSSAEPPACEEGLQRMSAESI